MKYKFSVLCLLMLLADSHAGDANDEGVKEKPTKVLTYKKFLREKKEYQLKLHVFEPRGHKPENKTPCIVLFHSGGWASGDPSKYYSTCVDYAARGMVAISVEYSIRMAHQGTPFDSVTDGKSAIRWVRTNAKTLGIDPDMIAAGGSSAGGQVAAAAALLTEFNDKTDDLKVSPKPNALVLVSPVFDNGPSGYGYSKVKDRWKEFSPAHNVAAGAPPTLVCMGDSEPKYLTVQAAQDFSKKMKDAGNRCEVLVLKGMEHGNHSQEHKELIKAKQLEFLASLGYLKK